MDSGRGDEEKSVSDKRKRVRASVYVCGVCVYVCVCKYYCVLVRGSEYACVCVCVRTCEYVCVCVRVCKRLCV